MLTNVKPVAVNWASSPSAAPVSSAPPKGSSDPQPSAYPTLHASPPAAGNINALAVSKAPKPTATPMAASPAEKKSEKPPTTAWDPKPAASAMWAPKPVPQKSPPSQPPKPTASMANAKASTAPKTSPTPSPVLSSQSAAGPAAASAKPPSAWAKKPTVKVDPNARGYGVAAFDHEAEFQKLPAEGVIDPKNIRYSQNSISSVFKESGESVQELADSLKDGSVKPSSIPPIRIVLSEGRIYTLDNRRLWAFRKAGVNIHYKKLDYIPERQTFKFTTKNNGEEIDVLK